MARRLSVMQHPFMLADAEAWIAYANGGKPEAQFAITVDDRVIGGIGVEIGEPKRMAVTRHAAEIGYWLGESHWGRGIASEAVAEFTEWAFVNLGVVRIHATVSSVNPASSRVLVKCGYALEGRMQARYLRDGVFWDSLCYAQVRLPGAEG